MTYDWRVGFQRKIDAQPNGCWEWRGRVDCYGYGTFGKKHRKAHRLAYELFVGPIPDGLELDHLCRNPLCVHPLHLEPVTHAENLRRGTGACVPRTHCKRGHEFTLESTYIWNDGSRSCRTCKRAYDAERRAA